MNINRISSLDLPYLPSTSQRRTTSDSGQSSSSSAQNLTDTVNFSASDNSSNKTDRPGVYVGFDGSTNVNINDALTSRDKELVIAATGGLSLIGPNGTHQINYLAMQIAMDRAIGNLDGPVTTSYLNNIISSERRDLVLNQQQADSLISAGDIASANALRGMGSDISFDVLDRALTFVAQHPES